MPTATRLPDNVKEQRDNARRALRELVTLAAQIDEARKPLDKLMARRRRLWSKLADLDPPVSWADIGRASGIEGETVLQAVRGRGRR